MTPGAFAALHAADYGDETPWDENAFTSLMADASIFAIGDACAAALGRVVLDEAELLTLATHPNHRKQGLGRVVLAQFEALARQKGALTAFLEVRATNHAALALYSNAGYAQTGRRKGYYRTPDGTKIDAILMSKPLT